MARTSFTAHPLRHLPCPPVRVAGATLRAALEEAFAANPWLRS